MTTRKVAVDAVRAACNKYIDYRMQDVRARQETKEPYFVDDAAALKIVQRAGDQTFKRVTALLSLTLIDHAEDMIYLSADDAYILHQFWDTPVNSRAY